MALKAVSDLGLNLKVLGFDHSETVAKDHVVSQDPKPGSQLKKKRAVRVVLSKGPAQVALPDLRGLTPNQARSILEQSRLKVGRVSRTYGSGPEQGPDRIMAQAPTPMTPVEAGLEVDLLVSLGPRPVHIVMPDLTGLTYRQALISLEEAGLGLGRLETESRPDWPDDSVLVQEPGPGRRVARGSDVVLTVNRPGSGQGEEYRLEILEYQAPFGFLQYEIKFRAALGPFVMDVYHDWRRPGERVRILALTRGDHHGQVFLDGEEVPLARNEIDSLGVFNDQDRPFRPFR